MTVRGTAVSHTSLEISSNAKARVRHATPTSVDMLLDCMCFTKNMLPRYSIQFALTRVDVYPCRLQVPFTSVTKIASSVCKLTRTLLCVAFHERPFTHLCDRCDPVVLVTYATHLSVLYNHICEKFDVVGAKASTSSIMWVYSQNSLKRASETGDSIDSTLVKQGHC